ncbi:MAG: hypothetical protein N5P05_004506 (plasmid) [Chroococcopsis gigantea SAG 12.99]|jgi:hypothetical protein|nr:hypothetical protein [Chroococcopsis gigantea SAG 12.99]
MSEQIHFLFRYQPLKTSKYGILLKYIGSGEGIMSRNDRILQPVAAFWLPFAYQQCSDLPLQELQRIARGAVYQLKLHIRYLEDSFGLSDDVPPPPPERLNDRESFEADNNDLGEPLNGHNYKDEDDILSQFT